MKKYCKWSFIYCSIFIILFFQITSCTKSEDQSPRDITWDRDTCVRCKMAVSDGRFAVQIRGPKGKYYFFDDIGCAINFIKNKSWKPQAKIWVMDYQSENWIDARTAIWHFNIPNTPMGYGFGATASSNKNDFINFKEVENQVYTNSNTRQIRIKP